MKSQDEDKTTSILEDPQLDKLEEEENKKPWKVEDEMTEAEQEYFDKIKNTEVSAEQHLKMAALKVMSDMDTFLKSLAFEYLEKVKISLMKSWKLSNNCPHPRRSTKQMKSLIYADLYLNT